MLFKNKICLSTKSKNRLLESFKKVRTKESNHIIDEAKDIAKQLNLSTDFPNKRI